MTSMYNARQWGPTYSHYIYVQHLYKLQITICTLINCKVAHYDDLFKNSLTGSLHCIYCITHPSH